jgi:hypothetical protein
MLQYSMEMDSCLGDSNVAASLGWHFDNHDTASSIPGSSACLSLWPGRRVHHRIVVSRRAWGLSPAAGPWERAGGGA